LHKPAGYLSVMEDPRGRPDLNDLVQGEGALKGARLFPVGRLDMASEGLILLTNDGNLANWLMHPRYEHPKTYLALARGTPPERELWKLRRGIELEGERTAPARVEVVDGWPRELVSDWWQEGMPDAPGPVTWLRITLREGKKRQIRRMLSEVGHPVLRLIRVGLGPLRLDQLAPGHSRPVTAYELRSLRRALREGQDAVPRRASWDMKTLGGREAEASADIPGQRPAKASTSKLPRTFSGQGRTRRHPFAGANRPASSQSSPRRRAPNLPQVPELREGSAPRPATRRRRRGR
jgi:pseudouridine synthase